MNYSPSDNTFRRAYETLRYQPPYPIVKPPKRKVFVSFDYENDRRYKFLLEAWHANDKFEFTFHDRTPQEIQSNDVGRIKAVLTTKVQQATHTLVLVGEYANQPHLDWQEIGCTNWIQFEIQQSILNRKKLVVVRLQPFNELPTNAIGQTGLLVEGFNQAPIIDALSRA